MSETSLLYNYLIVGGLMFALGAVGFLVRRNMIVMFLCAEMMLQGVSVSLVAWGRFHAATGGPQAAEAWGGQMLVIFIVTVAACEAGIAMALILMLAQRSGKLDATYWQDLREEGQPAFVDREVPEERADEQVWPHLTPSGVAPPQNVEEQMHRSRV
jgi:NADH-quinone oxidoreductase subunit K